MWPFLSSSWVAFGRPSYLWSVLPGVPRHGRFPPTSGGHPPRLLPPSGGGLYCLVPEAPQKGECRQGRRYFWPCRTRVVFGPATWPTLKMALCHIRALVRCIDKYQKSIRMLSRATRFHAARVLRYHGCTHLTATSSGRFNLFFTVLFKGYERSPSVGRSISGGRNRRPGGKHEEDSLRPAGLDHRSVPLIRLAAQR